MVLFYSFPLHFLKTIDEKILFAFKSRIQRFIFQAKMFLEGCVIPKSKVALLFFSFSSNFGLTPDFSEKKEKK